MNVLLPDMFGPVMSQSRPCSGPVSADQCRCVGLGVTSLILNVVGFGFGVAFAGGWTGVIVAGAWAHALSVPGAANGSQTTGCGAT